MPSRRNYPSCAINVRRSARIVTRNIRELPNVGRKVFVSVHFEKGDFPQWLSAVFDHMNAGRELGKFKKVYGKAKFGESFLDVILHKMIGCHIFLSVVTNPEDKEERGWPIYPYLVEELGASFTLPMPVIIAVERGCKIPSKDVGLLMGQAVQRCTFSKDNPEGFAQELAPALDAAPIIQAEQIEKVYKALGRLFH